MIGVIGISDGVEGLVDEHLAKSFANRLAENGQMLASIKRAAQAGLPIYAECGGLMYLAKEIVTKDGAAFPMAGVLPLSAQMTDRLVNFGYTEVSFTSDCLMGPAGGKAREKDRAGQSNVDLKRTGRKTPG